jgi:DeoR family transcriptional regulator, suf operon transcriptional repressor
MADEIFAADVAILDLLRKRDAMTVTELAHAMEVTATAVRQRLGRLLAQGYIERAATKAARGRPSHHYSLTTKGRRKTGANFADLAVALWQEIRGIEDAEVRRGLLQRISKRFSAMYADQVEGASLTERMESLAGLFADRGVPFEVEKSNPLPVLTALACPYPDLAEKDHSICAMERIMFSELLGENVKLSKCRLEGETCCTFEAGGKSATSGTREEVVLAGASG